MTTVAVTGAAGYLGRGLLEALAGRADVRRVVGIDVVEPKTVIPSLEFYRLDVRSPSLEDVLRDVDVVVHLAFVLAGMRDEEEMRDVNVAGTQNVFRAAVRAGAGHVVHLSSALGYGAHPDNDFPLTEESPVRGVRDFPYSAHKAEVEHFLSDFRGAHPELGVTILRPTFVLGPHITGAVARLVETPWILGIEGYSPPMQYVHEDDVIAAILFAADRRLAGAYNVAPDGWLDSERVAKILGKRRVTLDYEAAWRRADRMWRVNLSDLPPTHLPFLMYPWVMSNEKLTREGFSFRHSNEDALASAAEARRGWVALGRFRFRPRQIAIAAGALALAGSVAARQVRRRIEDLEA